MATPIPSPTPTPSPTVDPASITPSPAPSPTTLVEIVGPIEFQQQPDYSMLIVNIVIAGVTLLAAVATWVAVWQSSRAKDRAHMSGTIHPGGGGGDTPRVEIRFRNHGPIAAEEVQIERKAPGARTWTPLDTTLPSPMPPHTWFQFWASVANLQDPIATTANTPFPFTGVEPIEGCWRWRITWAGVPNPKRRKSHTVRRRVSERHMSQLLSVG